MKVVLLVLLTLGVSGSVSDDHILQYYYTGVSETGLGFPEFSVVAYMDDKQIHRYSSDTEQFSSVADWMNKEGSEYWAGELWRARVFRPVFRDHMRILMRLYNQTKGFHSGQWMYGCKLRDDGTTVGYSQMGYDGRDVIFLDTQRRLYIPIVHTVQLITQDWNSEKRWGEGMMFYLEEECVPQIKKFINLGREDLQKRVRPGVKVWGRPVSDKVTRLHCLVYGFHPRAVDVKLVRNEVDHVPLEETSPILPHPDGTYQIRVSAEVPTKEGDTYSCHVDHSSLEEILIVKWEPNNGFPLGITFGVAVGCLISVSAVAIAGIYMYRKKKLEYRRTQTSDTDPSSSQVPNLRPGGRMQPFGHFSAGPLRLQLGAPET